MNKLKFRDKTYPAPEKPTFEETFLVEELLGRPLEKSSHSAQIMGTVFLALRRAGHAMAWDELIKYSVEDIEIIETPEPVAELTDHPLGEGDGTAGSSASPSLEPGLS